MLRKSKRLKISIFPKYKKNLTNLSYIKHLKNPKTYDFFWGGGLVRNYESFLLSFTI